MSFEKKILCIGAGHVGGPTMAEKTKGTLLKDLKIGYRSITRNGGAKLDLWIF